MSRFVDQDYGSPHRGEPQLALTVPEAAKALRVSERTVYELISTGSLPVVKIGRTTRILSADLMAFLKARVVPRGTVKRQPGAVRGPVEQKAPAVDLRWWEHRGNIPQPKSWSLRRVSVPSQAVSGARVRKDVPPLPTAPDRVKRAALWWEKNRPEGREVGGV